MPNRVIDMILNLRVTDNTEKTTQSDHHNKIEQILNHIAMNTCTINLQQNDNNHTHKEARNIQTQNQCYRISDMAAPWWILASLLC
jgi:hypothetical protein